MLLETILKAMNEGSAVIDLIHAILWRSLSRVGALVIEQRTRETPVIGR